MKTPDLSGNSKRETMSKLNPDCQKEGIKDDIDRGYKALSSFEGFLGDRVNTFQVKIAGHGLKIFLDNGTKEFEVSFNADNYDQLAVIELTKLIEKNPEFISSNLMPEEIANKIGNNVHQLKNLVDDLGMPWNDKEREELDKVNKKGLDVTNPSEFLNVIKKIQMRKVGEWLLKTNFTSQGFSEHISSYGMTHEQDCWITKDPEKMKEWGFETE